MLSPAELTTFKKKIDAVVEILNKNRVAVTPVGYEATVTAGIFANMFRYKYNVANLAGKIPLAEIVLRFCPLSEELSTGKLRAGCMEVEHCDLWLNDLDITVSLAGTHLYEAIDNKKPLDEAFAKMNEIFQAPEVFQKMAEGVMLYTNSIMVIAAKDRPYWLPVTAGEYFDLQIRYHSI